MAPRVARFQIDPRLTTVLGESYTSSEHALKELIDNAWDADAPTVKVTMPVVATFEVDPGPIVIRDDGSGMTTMEVLNVYLRIAKGRQQRSGDKTAGLNRRVKGKKGIGKFSGFAIADQMQIETRAHGTCTRISLSKKELLDAGGNLEKVRLDHSATPCPKHERGTTVTLTGLNALLKPPSPERFNNLLYWEYRHEQGFAVEINGAPLSLDGLDNELHKTEVIKLPNGATAQIRYHVMETNAKHPGLVMLVNGKTVGRPDWYGLEDHPEFTTRMRRRVVGEIIADGVDVSTISADGQLLDSSRDREVIAAAVVEHVGGTLRQSFAQESALARGRITQATERRIAALPEHRRPIAERRINDLVTKHYPEFGDRIEAMVWLLLEAIERDEYWDVCKAITVADHSDVAKLAGLLADFGLADMALIAYHTKRRLTFLDEVEALAADKNTLEAQVHQALENNLWIFGPQYYAISSNKTHKRIVHDHLDQKFSDPKRESKRPDLLLAELVPGSHLLIEFKRPSKTVGRDDGNQALKYADDLLKKFAPMDVLVVGGQVDTGMSEKGQDGVKFTSYTSLIGAARTHLDWLLAQLSDRRESASPSSSQ